jgi:hypothetical protein
MRITDYRFGYIKIDGKQYSADLILLSDRIVEGWRRQEGHSLAPEDLKEVVSACPNILVVGTGNSGQMKVPEGTQRYLTDNGVELRVAKTADAVELFNQLRLKFSSVAGAFHLTC